MNIEMEWKWNVLSMSIYWRIERNNAYIFSIHI